MRDTPLGCHVMGIRHVLERDEEGNAIKKVHLSGYSFDRPKWCANCGSTYMQDDSFCSKEGTELLQLLPPDGFDFNGPFGPFKIVDTSPVEVLENITQRTSRIWKKTDEVYNPS